MRRDHRGDLRGGAARAARRRQVHDRRQAFRNGRGQSCGRRRGDAARQPVPAAPRPSQEPCHPLAAASQPQLFLLRPLHRSDQPGAAHRRGAPRQSVRIGDRARPNPAARTGRRPAAMAARSPDAQHSHRRDRQHPSGGNLHRQALFAGRPDRPSRPRRVPRLRNAAGPAHEPRPAIARSARSSPACGATRSTGRCRAGARHCTTDSCCPTSSGRTSSTCSPTSERMGWPSAPTGTRRRPNFVFRSAARSNTRASSSSCARRSSPGMCWARPAPSAARRAIPTARPSACRSN